jgi:hypothetical protein
VRRRRIDREAIIGNVALVSKKIGENNKRLVYSAENRKNKFKNLL